MTTLQMISKHLQVDKQSLIQEGILAFLEKKKAEVLRDRLSILTKYNVDSEVELEQKIKKGNIAEHPAWEDLITLENIEHTLKIIDNDLRRLQKSG